MKLRITKNNNDGDKKPNATIPITNQNRKDWNAYVSYLQTKGLAGNPILDHADYGNKVLSDYIKANPTTSLRPELILPIQQDFANYRQYALNQIKQGKGQFAPNTDENNFMLNLSKPDGWSGSMTTKHTFPLDYLTYIENNKPQETVVQGFATTK